MRILAGLQQVLHNVGPSERGGDVELREVLDARQPFVHLRVRQRELVDVLERLDLRRVSGIKSDCMNHKSMGT